MKLITCLQKPAGLQALVDEFGPQVMVQFQEAYERIHTSYTQQPHTIKNYFPTLAAKNAVRELEEKYRKK